ESRDSIRVTWRHKRDPMIRMRHVQIDSRYVSAVRISVRHLMPLKQEMPAVIVAFCRATGIMIKNQISVFIRLGTTAVAEISESRNHARGVLEQIHAFRE